MIIILKASYKLTNCKTTINYSMLVVINRASLSMFKKDLIAFEAIKTCQKRILETQKPTRML